MLLSELESKKLLSQSGIPVVQTELTSSKEEAVSTAQRLGFPIVLKIVSSDISHKSDAGGVKLGLTTPQQVGDAYDAILKSIGEKYPTANIHGISVQKMARPGLELIIGMSTDAQFGPVLMFGLGGIWVEILKDVSFRVVPLLRKDAAEMVREIKGYPLLKGYRGHEAVDISLLEDILLKVSNFVEKNPHIKELDINPLFAYSNDAVAVDARIVVE